MTCTSKFLQCKQLTQCVSYVLLTVVTCPELTDPNNGIILKPNNNYLSTAVYTCNTGYVLTPSDGGTRVCGADGEWTGVAPTCPRELVITVKYNAKVLLVRLMQHSC